MSTRAKTPWNRTAALAGLVLSSLTLAGCGVAMPTAPSLSNDSSILVAPHGTSASQSASRISNGDEGSSGGSGTIQTNPNDTLPNSTPLGAPQTPSGGPGAKNGNHGHHHHKP